MAQKIDTNEYTDQFTDGTVRYAASGIDRISKNTWITSIGYSQNQYIVRLYQNNMLANFDASSVVPLTMQSMLNVYKTPNVLVSSYLINTWVNISTGVYSITETVPLDDGLYIFEVELQTAYTNPEVINKISVITDASTSYPVETINTTWVSSSSTIAAKNYNLDAVDFALNGNISFK